MARFIMVALTVILATGCGGTHNLEESHGFIEYSGQLIKSDKASTVTLPLAIAEGEVANLKIGASYAFGSKSSRSSCDVVIKRVGHELEAMANGQGGAPIVWQKRKGQSLQCTKSLTEVETPITYKYVIELEKGH